MIRRFLPVLFVLPVLWILPMSCSDRGVSESPEGRSAAAPTSQPASPAAAPPAPAEVPLMSSRGVPMTPAGAPTTTTTSTGEIVGAGLVFKFPETWQAVPPASSMRLAQAQLPGGGELMVFHLGVGGGGGVEANLDRWVGQMEVAADTPPERLRFEAGTLVVHLIDVAGTLLPSTMGTGPSTPQPNSRLLGAVVEGPGGPWFFKATGPGAALAEQRSQLVAMLQAAHPATS